MRGFAIADVAFAAVVVLAFSIGPTAASPESGSPGTATDSSVPTTTEAPQPGWMLPRNVFGNRLGRSLSVTRPGAAHGRTPYVGIRPLVVAHPKPAGTAAITKAAPRCGSEAQQKDCQTTASADGAANKPAPPPRRIRLNLGSIRPAQNSASFAARTAPPQTTRTSPSILPDIHFQTEESGEGRRKDRNSSVHITLGRF